MWFYYPFCNLPGAHERAKREGASNSAYARWNVISPQFKLRQSYYLECTSMVWVVRYTCTCGKLTAVGHIRVRCTRYMCYEETHSTDTHRVPCIAYVSLYLAISPLPETTWHTIRCQTDGRWEGQTSIWCLVADTAAQLYQTSMIRHLCVI